MKVTLLDLVLMAGALLARNVQAYPSFLACSRSIDAGSTIMGSQVQLSSVASLKLASTAGMPYDCGGRLPPGETGLTFHLSGQSGQYLVEATASAGTGSGWGIIGGTCSMTRDTTVSKTYTVPAHGTVTLRVVWSNGYGQPVYVTPECTYSVGCSANASRVFYPGATPDQWSCSCNAGYGGIAACMLCEPGKFMPPGQPGVQECKVCPSSPTSPFTSPAGSTSFSDCVPVNWPPAELAGLNAAYAFSCGSCWFYTIQDGATTTLSKTGTCAFDCLGYMSDLDFPIMQNNMVVIDGFSFPHGRVANVTHLADGIFEGVGQSISTLSIQQTSLSVITSNTLKGLENLQIVNLINNKIDHIATDAFNHGKFLNPDPQCSHSSCHYPPRLVLLAGNPLTHVTTGDLSDLFENDVGLDVADKLLWRAQLESRLEVAQLKLKLDGADSTDDLPVNKVTVRWGDAQNAR